MSGASLIKASRLVRGFRHKKYWTSLSRFVTSNNFFEIGGSLAMIVFPREIEEAIFKSPFKIVVATNHRWLQKLRLRPQPLMQLFYTSSNSCGGKKQKKQSSRLKLNYWKLNNRCNFEKCFSFGSISLRTRRLTN